MALFTAVYDAFPVPRPFLCPHAPRGLPSGPRAGPARRCGRTPPARTTRSATAAIAACTSCRRGATAGGRPEVERAQRPRGGDARRRRRGPVRLQVARDPARLRGPGRVSIRWRDAQGGPPAHARQGRDRREPAAGERELLGRDDARIDLRPGARDGREAAQRRQRDLADGPRGHWLRRGHARRPRRLRRRIRDGDGDRRARSKAVAQIFAAGVSAGSSADRQAQSKDGDLAACRTSGAGRQRTAGRLREPSPASSWSRSSPQKRGEPDRRRTRWTEGDRRRDRCAPPASRGTACQCVRAAERPHRQAVRPGDGHEGAVPAPPARPAAPTAATAYAVLKKPIGGRHRRAMKRKTRSDYDETDVPLLERACAAGNAAACQASALYHGEFAAGPARAARRRTERGEPEGGRPPRPVVLVRRRRLLRHDRRATPIRTRTPHPIVRQEHRQAGRLHAGGPATSGGAGRAVTLGDMHRDGMGVKQDGAAALAAYERQCSAGGYFDGQRGL
jgi:hypothetical protein